MELGNHNGSNGHWPEKVRVFLARRLFSSAIPGIKLGDWWKLLRENRFRVEPSYWPRAGLISVSSVWNSVLAAWERGRYGRRILDVQAPAPIFVIGHWRSGTTHVQNLLSRDPGLAAPNFYESLFPHTFLTTERSGAAIFGRLAPKTRLIDNMSLDRSVPCEDEFALGIATLKSPYLGLSFPRAWKRYDRYLTLRGLPEEEVETWKQALLWFVRKLTLRHGKPLVLKSPPHTCRIRFILDVFPDARFVHVHRDPYVVYQSMHRMLEKGLPTAQLQRHDPASLQEFVLDRYRAMYDAYLEDRPRIPEGHRCEVAFADLERDPVETIRTVYETLSLPGFDAALVPLREYVESLRGYRKHEHAELPEDLRRLIASRWGRFFAEFGYAT